MRGTAKRSKNHRVGNFYNFIKYLKGLSPSGPRALYLWLFLWLLAAFCRKSSNYFGFFSFPLNLRKSHCLFGNGENKQLSLLDSSVKFNARLQEIFETIVILCYLLLLFFYIIFQDYYKCFSRLLENDSVNEMSPPWRESVRKQLFHTQKANLDFKFKVLRLICQNLNGFLCKGISKENKKK